MWSKKFSDSTGEPLEQVDTNVFNIFFALKHFLSGSQSFSGVYKVPYDSSERAYDRDSPSWLGSQQPYHECTGLPG